ncbi:MAG: hypothetical protein J6C95_00425 [Muribaculaceae bacterium]|nr:hypothetical protein [Muribaculaceae bacterium]
MKKIRQIPRPQLVDARRLSPMEMNNLHFHIEDSHSHVADAPKQALNRP